MKRLIPGLAALLTLLLVALTGCGATNNGVVTGNGQIVEYPKAADRGTPINLSGVSLDGTSINIADYRGKVVVINLWWSGCGPCLAEAPKLKAAYAMKTAVFIGINVRDNSADQGLAFERTQGITYPSIYSPDGQAVLAFSGSGSLQVVPATVVLDKEGRVAAVVRGAIQGNDTLKALIQDASKAAL